MSTGAVLFDFDDTLYPYPPCNEAGKRAAWRTARELGYDFDREAFETFYRRGRREAKREIPDRAASHERVLYFKRALEIRTGTAEPADARAMGEAYWDGYLEEMSLFPGVEETLAALRDAGIDVAVVTNLTARIQLRKLEHLGLGGVVDVLVTSEETGREKPGSVTFTVALARLDRRPSEAVMVGDSVASDVVGGNAVGLETVLFNGDVDGRELEDHERPDHEVDAFEEVLEVVL